jgi:hypothetical protein
MAGVIGGSSVARDGHAGSSCRPVSGKIHSLFTPTGCTSPIGLCTAGTITGGELDGATTFLALSAAPSAGMPSVEPAANLSYSGELTIDTHCGTLVTHDLGVLDATGLAFTEIERPFSGTGVFENATNDFFISGAITDGGNGFTGELRGILCASR